MHPTHRPAGCPGDMQTTQPAGQAYDSAGILGLLISAAVVYGAAYFGARAGVRRRA